MLITRLTRAGRELGGDAGITLVELLVSITLLLGVTAAATMLLVVAVRSEPQVSKRDYEIQQARAMQDRFAHELRQSPQVTSGTASQVSFQTYVRRVTCGSTAVPATSAPAILCKVTYTCTGGTCTRSETTTTDTGIGTGQTLVSGITNTDVFGYLPSATAANYVSTKLVFPSQAGDDAITLQDGVELRNFG